MSCVPEIRMPPAVRRGELGQAGGKEAQEAPSVHSEESYALPKFEYKEEQK